MSIIKIRVPGNVIFFLTLATLLAGCTPAGPRALLNGKRLLERGHYAEAIEELKVAESLLNTNAQVWNYLGVAFQHTGQADNAVRAYRRAYGLDQNLVEAHYNLGCLWLEQNRPDLAKPELTAFTLQRPEYADGWVQLGTAQLRLARSGTASARAAELLAAERSFNSALHANPRNPEALNGLGLVQFQRDHPAAAAQFFENALTLQPDYAPALLNLAIVAQTRLNNRALALQKYREYLALKPQPADWGAVNAIARELEQELSSRAAAAAPPPRANPPQLTARSAAPANVPVVVTQRPSPVTSPTNPPRTTPSALAANTSSPATVQAATPAIGIEPDKVSPQPAIRPAQDIPAPVADATSAPSPPVVVAATNQPAATPPVARRGFLQRVNPLNLFRRNNNPPSPSTLTTVPERTKAVGVSSSSPDTAAFPRYRYHAILEPAAGNHSAAERAFAQGWQDQQAGHMAEAIQAYHQAVAADPSYYDAYYNLGLAAISAGKYAEALNAYETALAIRPESLDGRYNFALALEKMNYVIDAAGELEKLLKTYPQESRAHVALGNIYAQKLRDSDKARDHYTKALEINPSNPQSAAIRYWLSANPR